MSTKSLLVGGVSSPLPEQPNEVNFQILAYKIRKQYRREQQSSKVKLKQVTAKASLVGIINRTAADYMKHEDDRAAC